MFVIWVPYWGGWVFDKANASSGEKVRDQDDGVLEKEGAHDGLEVMFFSEVW